VSHGTDQYQRALILWQPFYRQCNRLSIYLTACIQKNPTSLHSNTLYTRAKCLGVVWFNIRTHTLTLTALQHIGVMSITPDWRTMSCLRLVVMRPCLDLYPRQILPSRFQNRISRVVHMYLELSIAIHFAPLRAATALGLRCRCVWFVERGRASCDSDLCGGMMSERPASSDDLDLVARTLASG
jgi:hypothetical protein